MSAGCAVRRVRPPLLEQPVLAILLRRQLLQLPHELFVARQPPGSQARVTLSGTQVREMLVGGIAPPIEFSRPEVARILIEAMQERVTPHHAI